MTSSKKIEAGDEIASKCLKCKDVTNHTIVAMADDSIAKVLCKVCGARHNYRPPETAKTPKKKTARSTGPGVRAAKIKDQYEELLAGRNGSRALPYSMTGIFKHNDLIDHSTFGLGVITKIIKPNKIEVMFPEGGKLLICGQM